MTQRIYTHRLVSMSAIINQPLTIIIHKAINRVVLLINPCYIIITIIVLLLLHCYYYYCCYYKYKCYCYYCYILFVCLYVYILLIMPWY